MCLIHESTNTFRQQLKYQFQLEWEMYGLIHGSNTISTAVFFITLFTCWHHDTRGRLWCSPREVAREILVTRVSPEVYSRAVREIGRVTERHRNGHSSWLKHLSWSLVFSFLLANSKIHSMCGLYRKTQWGSSVLECSSYVDWGYFFRNLLLTMSTAGPAIIHLLSFLTHPAGKKGLISLGCCFKGEKNASIGLCMSPLKTASTASNDLDSVKTGRCCTDHIVCVDFGRVKFQGIGRD